MSLSKHAVGITLAVALTAPLGASASPFGTPEAKAATPAASTPSAAASQTAAQSAASKAAARRASRAQARAEFGSRTIAVASRYQGVPYRAGGTTPRGFDCSGFTRFVFDKLDKRLPRTSQEQFRKAHRIKHPQRGDLLFYHSGSKRGRVYHVVIYAGNGKVWHAPRPGDRVRKGKIYAKHWTAGRY